MEEMINNFFLGLNVVVFVATCIVMGGNGLFALFWRWIGLPFMARLHIFGNYLAVVGGLVMSVQILMQMGIEDAWMGFISSVVFFFFARFIDKATNPRNKIKPISSSNEELKLTKEEDRLKKAREKEKWNRDYEEQLKKAKEAREKEKWNRDYEEQLKKAKEAREKEKESKIS